MAPMGRVPLSLALLALAAAAPASAATSSGYRTTCGVELSRGVAVTPGGPICGTDEGDDVGYGGEDAAISFFGENGHDTVQGSRHADQVNGGGGNDEVHGGRGDDRLDGGDDSDVLFGGLGDDVLVERRFGVREHLYGGPGNDLVAGGRGNDFVYGGTGNDVVLGGNGPDRLFAGPGDDILYGGSGRDVFDCGPGNDTAYRVRGSADRDGLIPRSAGCERIVNTDPTREFPLRGVRGSNGQDSLVGTGEAELLEGKGGADRIFGGGGDDELEGDGASLQGGDLLMGGSGNDRIAGRSGDDRIYGDARSATAGPPGTDELVGGSGRDLLVGGPGNDLVAARYDGDRVLAGAGSDVINLLGGDTGDENARVFVDCGPGRDVVVINPARRGTFRRCESFAEQFYTADFGFLFRPSPEVYPPTVRIDGPAAAAARRRPGRGAQDVPPPAPAEPAGGASNPSISGDGNRVAFSADARNLAEGDTNLERTDPFVRDLPTAVTLLADATRGGTSAERGGRFGRTPGRALSGDGRYAVFSSNTPDVAGRVVHYTIFRRDLTRRLTQVACRRGNDDSENPAISAGGHHIAFESRATNLAGRDANRQTDVYWCDMFTGEVRRVSSPVDDSVNGSGTSLDPSISADGRYVAFTSDAGGLVPGDGRRAGVYWRDMQTGETKIVDVPAGALASNGNGQNPRISPDGRFVVFDSDATDLAGGELNGATIDVFRKDVIDGGITLVSQGADGSGANGDSTADSISGDGQAVGFSSSASNLVPGDGNGHADAFVRSLPLAVNSRVSTRQDASELAGSSSGVALSFDGRYAAFGSREPRTRIYRKDVGTGALDHVTVGIDLPPRSLIGEPFGSELRRKVRLVAGTARDDSALAAVDVAVSRRAGRRGCIWLGRRGALVRRACDEPLWLRARLTSGLRFTLRIGRLLPRGTWTARSRATDAGGAVEGERPGANVASFTLR